MVTTCTTSSETRNCNEINQFYCLVLKTLVDHYHQFQDNIKLNIRHWSGFQPGLDVGDVEVEADVSVGPGESLTPRFSSFFSRLARAVARASSVNFFIASPPRPWQSTNWPSC